MKRARGLSLLTRVFLANGVVLLIIALLLLFSPIEIDFPVTSTTDEIADTLVISKKTVEHHRSHVLEKLGMRDRVELTRYAIRRGLVEP
jgi:hypothetical protein